MLSSQQVCGDKQACLPILSGHQWGCAAIILGPPCICFALSTQNLSHFPNLVALFTVINKLYCYLVIKNFR